MFKYSVFEWSIPFKNRTFEIRTIKCSVFECIRNSNVRYLSTHCIGHFCTNNNLGGPNNDPEFELWGHSKFGLFHSCVVPNSDPQCIQIHTVCPILKSLNFRSKASLKGNLCKMVYSTVCALSN